MRNPFPRRNLPPEAEPWGREHDVRVSNLSSTVERLAQEVSSLRTQAQALTRISSTVTLFRSAHANADGDFTIPGSTYTSVASGTFTAPIGKSRGVLIVNSTVAKRPDDPGVTDNWIASSVVVSSMDVSYRLPGSSYFGYREPSSFGREVSLISASRQFEFPYTDVEYEISFDLQVACGISNFDTRYPTDIASVDVVALFYGEVTPDDDV